MQKADDLNRRLAFRRMKFTSPRSPPQFGSAVNSTCTTGLRGEHRVASASQSYPQSTICPVCLMVVCDSAIIPCGHCLCCTSSDTNFDCYRVCTLPCMQNWHFRHHMSPFLDVTLLAVTRDSWQIFIRVSFKMCGQQSDGFMLGFSVGVEILQYMHSFYVQNL